MGKRFKDKKIKFRTGLSKELKGKIRYRLTNDYMFRAVMQKNKNVLKHLICALLEIPLEQVIELTIENPIELGKAIDRKTCILDIKVLLNNNQYINIEMQVSKQEYWKERSLSYLCRTYDNLDSGEEYDKVIPAIQISILDFDLFENVEELLSKYYLMNVNPEYRNFYANDFAIYVLNLHQIYNDKVIRKEKDTDLYQWARLFKAESWEEIRMLAEQNEVFDECATTLAQLTEDEKIRMQCEARNDYIARQKGLEKRIHQKVVSEITQEVTQRVTQEVTQQVTQQVSIGIARSLLDVLDVQIISEKTGLSVEQVEQLRERNAMKG